jgi:adenosylhomocysteinase
MSVMHEVKNLDLASQGKARIEWAEQDMPVLRSIKDRYIKEQPFKGITISACLHVTTETANLMIALKAGGANVFLCASNPLSTQDDTAAALVQEYGISTFAIKGEDNQTYFKHLNTVLDQNPHMTMDDGADLVSELHKNRQNQIASIIGGTEETTTGVVRLKAMAAQGKLQFPVLAVNDAMTKHLFDNRYGTGQSTMDGIIRATNRLIAGSVFVVAGYGWCSKGLAMRARGMGALVIVTEVDPIKALEAVMDGFQVMEMEKAVKNADFVCTLTGDKNVVDSEDFAVMKNGCIISNSGHFDSEINVKALAEMAVSRRIVKPFVEEFTMKDGRTIYLLADGRLVNLASAEGHPASVMDMSFANQALGAEFILKNYKELQKQVYVIPTEVDREIASLKLASLGITIDVLTAEQEKYLNSWEEGTE